MNSALQSVSAPAQTTGFIPQRIRWTVAALLLLFVVQCAWFIRTQSFTIDESDHIIAGLDAWHYGEFERWHEHPPLARLWMTLPLLGADCKYENRPVGGGPIHSGSRLDPALRENSKSQDSSGWWADSEAVPISPAPEMWLYRARSMNVIFGVALLLLLWMTARRTFSEGAALFALALAALSPELIAHYSVATTDGAGVLFTFLAIIQLMRWRRERTRLQTALLGVAFGLALLSKLNSLPAFAIGLFIVLVSGASLNGKLSSRAKKLSSRAKKLSSRAESRDPFVPAAIPSAAKPKENGAVHRTPARREGCHPERSEGPLSPAKSRALRSPQEPPPLELEGRICLRSNRGARRRAGYFFHISHVVFANGVVTLHFAGYTKLLSYALPFDKSLQLFIPACEFLTGIGMVVVHNMEGHHSFFLGQVSDTGGWKMYFPVAILLKWPLLILLTALAGAASALRRRIPRELLLMSIFPAVFFLLAVTGRINIGVRHVLPVYPFLLLYAAAAWQWTEKKQQRESTYTVPSGGVILSEAKDPYSQKPVSSIGVGGALWATNASRAAKSVLIAVLCLQAVDTLRVAPDYLSYFNVYIDPARTYEYLSDSNNDWGQGLIALHNYQTAHPNETLHLAYFGMIDPAWYGIRYMPLNEGERPTGTVIVSATHLSGELLRNPNEFHWLLAYPRKAILNHTLFVFEVPAGAGK